MVAAARSEIALEAPDRALEAQWADLWERSDAAPFVHPGWVRAWCTAHDTDVRLATVRRDGVLVAALPVMERRGRFALPADWHTPVTGAVAADDAALEDLAGLLASASPAAVSLDFVEAGSPTAVVVPAALRSAGYRVATLLRMNSPYLDLSAGAGAYFDGLDGRKRRELRRRSRRLEEAGEVRFEVSDGRVGREALLDEVFAVEAAGWKGSRGTAIASDPRIEAMYRAAAAWAAAFGVLVVGTLRLDGRVVAFDYSLESKGVHYLLKTGFDPEAARFAPAMQLRARMIERAFGAGLERYEFAGTDDPWKLEWTTATRPIVRIDAYAPGTRGRASRASDVAARRLRRLRRRLRS